MRRATICLLFTWLSKDTMPKTATTENEKSIGINKLVFLGLFLPMVALVVIIGLSLATIRMDERISEILESDSTHLQLVSGFLGAEVLSSLKHLRALAAEALTREALDAGRPGTAAPAAELLPDARQAQPALPAGALDR